MPDDYVKQRIEQLFAKDKEAEKRQVTMNFPEVLIERLDNVLKARAQLKGSPVTRNTAMQEALEIYLDSAEAYLKHQHVEIPKKEEHQEPLDMPQTFSRFDTVIYPGDVDGFYNVFMRQKLWYYVRIGKDKLPHIRYMGLYVKRPISAITHYAKVKEIVPSREIPGKYVIHLDGDPIKLKQPVKLGDTSPAATRSPKYCTLQRLTHAKYFGEL